MPEFSARPDRLEQIANEICHQRQQLNQLAQETREITTQLKMLTQMEQPLHLLAQCHVAMQEQIAALGCMSQTLDTVGRLYRRTEESVLQAGDGGTYLFQQIGIMSNPLPEILPDTGQQLLETFQRLLKEVPPQESVAFPLAERMTLFQVIGSMNPRMLPVTIAGVVERCGWWYGNDIAGRMCNTGVVAMLSDNIIHQLQT